MSGTGWVVLWTCLCADAADAAEWLPELCPGHDRPVAAGPIKNNRPGATAPGHRCGEKRCTETLRRTA